MNRYFLIFLGLLVMVFIGQGNCETCDADGDGWCPDEGDCNDEDPYIHPGAEETCDGVDENCNGEIDDGAMTTYYLDLDGDGYGTPDGAIDACESPGSEYVTRGGDCADRDPSINPGAPEMCDGFDNNCNDMVDEDVTTAYYDDRDNDGYGNPASETLACEPPSPDSIEVGGDCNDSDAAINPEAEEVCDGVDNNCDRNVDEGVEITFYWDADGDTYGDPESATAACEPPGPEFVARGGDCNDLDAAINPDALEICDAVDNNCDGNIDEGWTMGEDEEISCCYQVFECGEWYDCLEVAQAFRSDFVTIRDGATQRWLMDTFGTESMYWIGYSDEDREGIWTWMSGEQSIYTNWAEGEPNDQEPCGEDYGIMNWVGSETPGQWNDIGPCSEEWPSVTQAIFETCSAGAGITR